MDGSGTEIDPWLITSTSEFFQAVRATGSAGFYRLMIDIGVESIYNLPAVQVITSSSYPARVIDGAGRRIRVNSAQGSSNASCAFSNIHFRNVRIDIVFGSSSSWPHYLFYRCSLVDVAIYARLTTGSATAGYWLHADANTPSLIPRAVERVALFLEGSPASPQTAFLQTLISGVVATRCYVYAAGTSSGGLTRLGTVLTLSVLDDLSGGVFTDAGWWASGLELAPYQTEIVTFSVETITGSGPVARIVWLENERLVVRLGETGDGGIGAFAARVLRYSSFTLFASEDYAANELRAQLLVVAGQRYLPPTENGFVYIAGGSGRLLSLDGVVLGGDPVTIDGVEFTPRPAFGAVMSGRRSVQRFGLSQSLVLNNSGSGGGPVIDGDPAYLDGVVEEVHPTLGTVRPLANSEVAVFERRGDAYVAMGRALSNAVGEFRVETQVYGGGDVFAFAADFPGVTWAPGVALNLGERLRPTMNNGYVYEIVEAGVSGATEPAWWADQGDGTEGYIGTARAKARPYYQPVGHGPLKMTLVDP